MKAALVSAAMIPEIRIHVHDCRIKSLGCICCSNLRSRPIIASACCRHDRFCHVVPAMVRLCMPRLDHTERPKMIVTARARSGRFFLGPIYYLVPSGSGIGRALHCKGGQRDSQLVLLVSYRCELSMILREEHLQGCQHSVS